MQLFLILTTSYSRSLYPHLEDHAKVESYPSVRGMAKDIWFFHHTNKENSGGDDGVSKCNTFEVSKLSAFISIPFLIWSGGNGQIPCPFLFTVSPTPDDGPGFDFLHAS
jgi:hypothetical protein